MFVSSNASASLSSGVISGFETLIAALTRRLLCTVIFLVVSRVRNSQLTSPPTITTTDIRTAVDILGFPRHFRAHFMSLPSRMYPMGVRCIHGTKTNYWEKFGTKKEEKIEDLETVEAILNSAPIPKRTNSVDTKDIWPEEWSPRHGFKWEVETEQSDEGKESDSEFENSSGSVEMETPEIGIAQADERDGSLSPRIWRPKPDMVHEEQTLLEAETTYLDALDAQSGHLESEWLSRYMKDGEIGARRWKKNAYKNMTTNEETRTAKHNWEKVRRRFTRKFGRDWCSFAWDGVGMEGNRWEQPPEDWQLFQKKNPACVGGLGPRKRRLSAECDVRKRKQTRVESDDSVVSDVDYSELDESEGDEL
jgi:hypothetical protein